MLVGPPEALKTAFMKSLERYPTALLLSDLNTQQLAKIRQNVTSGTVKTVVILDWQKLYERDKDTAANVEGNLRALASEGFTSASFEPDGINRRVAHAVVMGALTNNLLEQHYVRWQTSGFMRRFLFPSYVLKNPYVLSEAINSWEKIPLSDRFISPPANGEIPFNVTENERKLLQAFTKYQYGISETHHTICKIFAVLKWHYREMGKPKEAWRVITDFGESLGKEGAVLEL